MIRKNVTYSEYQILKAIYINVTIIRANDHNATVIIYK